MTAEDWSLVVTDRDGTLRATFQAGDTPENAPVVGSNGQDPLNDVGAGMLQLPLTSEYIDQLVENRFLHVKSSGDTVTSMILGATSEDVLPLPGSATVALRSLVDILNEGWVWAAPGFDADPPGRERHFDFSDPRRDNSDFDTADEQGTVTDAAGTYFVYGAGITHPDDVKAIGPPGYTFATTDSHDGWTFLVVDHYFSATGRYRFRGVADNELTTLRVNGSDIQGKTWGFERAWSVDVQITENPEQPHRVAAVIYNQIDPVAGAPHGIGTTNFSMEVVKLNDDGSEGDLELVTDAGWAVMAFPTNAPGMTFTQVAGICLTENHEGGLLGDVDIDPIVDEFTDSNGVTLTQQWDITTRAWMPLGDFFLHEMGRYFCDIKVAFDEDAGRTIWYLYSLGGRGNIGEGNPAFPAIEPDEVTEMRIDRERTAATKLAVEYQLGFTLLETSPPAGQPSRGAFLSLGQLDTLAQVQRLGGPELGDFARTREKLSILHETTDGRDYWTADSIDSVPVDRFMGTDGARVMSMTWEINRNGNMAFTPEFFDIVIPVAARSANAMRRMGPGSVGGRSRPPRST